LTRLIGWRIRVALARYRSSKPLLIVSAALFAVLLALGIALSWFIFTVLVRLTPAFADTMLLLVFGGIGAFQLLAGVRWGLQRLFLESDLELLLGSPISMSKVFTLKLIDLAISNPVALALLFATAWGYTRAHHVPGAIVVALIAGLVLTVVTTFPGMLISLVLARYLSGARLRTLLAVIPAVIGLGFAIAGPTIGTFFGSAGGETLDVERLNDLARVSSTALSALPTSWAADIAIGVAHEGLAVAVRGLGLMIAVGVGTGLLAYWTFERTFLRSWTTLSEASSRSRRSSILDRLADPFGGSTRALVAKEWKMYTRDLRILASAFFPAAFMTYFIINSSANDSAPPYGLVAFLAFFIPGQASQSLLNEKRNITLLRSAPMRGVDILRAKLLAFFPGVALLAIGASVGLVIVDRLTVVQAIVLAFGGAWVVGWVTWGQLGLAALTGKFDTERSRMSLLAVIAGMLHTSLFAGAHVLIFLWLGARLGGSQSALAHPLVGVPLTIFAGGLCVATVILANEGGSRLERLDTP
jgi:hypothetical protein